MDLISSRGGLSVFNTQEMVLRQPQTPASMLNTILPHRPFPLLELPPEIQRLIIEHYFGTWSVIMDQDRYNMFRSRLRIHGVPPIDLLLTCRAIYHVANPIRHNSFTGKLTLMSVFILITLRRKVELIWFKKMVRTLHFNESSVDPQKWSTYFTGFDRLEHIEIDNPSTIRLGPDFLELEKIVNGELQDTLLATRNTFEHSILSTLVNLTSVVVDQKYCLLDSLMDVGWTGVLHARYVSTQSGTKIADLWYDADAKVISKRDFTRPREL